MSAASAKQACELKLNGRRVPVSHLEKVFYPETGFTKGQVIDYYIKIAPFLLPHLKNRALTMKRYPNGVTGEFFYEKRCPSYRPSWMKTASVWSEKQKEEIQYCMANDLASLVWMANLADLELHTSLALSKNTDQPGAIVFDLDPGAPADVIDCARIAIRLRDLLKESGIKSFVKTSGSKGLQVYAPLNTRITFDATKAFAHGLAQRISAEDPKNALSQMGRQLRKGKVFIDWSQNDSHKTTVCVYSLRAKEKPTVSTPVAWDEVERALRTGKAASLTLQAGDVIKRCKKFGDLFAPVLTLKQKLPR